MPIIADWREGGSEIRLIGDLAATELRDCVFSYSSDPRADDASYKIIDMRETESIGASAEELEVLGAFEYGHTLSTPNVRLAFVTPDDRFDAHIDAFTRLTRESTWQVRIFRDRDEAVAWATGPRGVSLSEGGL